MLYNCRMIRKVLSSVANAIKGLKSAFDSEINFKIELVAICIVAFAFAYLDINEWILLSIVSVFMLFAELINTAIEKITDFISPDYNERIGEIKDISAGAVLFSVICFLSFVIYIIVKYGIY